MKLSINQIKYYKSLQERKHRQNYHNFIVEGVKLAHETLSSQPNSVESVVAVPNWLQENQHLIPEGAVVVPVAEGELKKISMLSTPNQVFLVVKQPSYHFDKNTAINGLALYLDDIRDPGNLGTILRIADWFGIEWVFCSPNTVEVFNPKVVQASMGAFLRVKCLEMDFGQLFEKYPEIPRYGAVLDGDSIFDMLPETPAIIAIGNESKGLSTEIQAQLTHRIAIPKGKGGGAESLNAAIATGIVCAFFAKK